MVFWEKRKETRDDNSPNIRFGNEYGISHTFCDCLHLSTQLALVPNPRAVLLILLSVLTIRFLLTQFYQTKPRELTSLPPELHISHWLLLLLLLCHSLFYLPALA